jgi:hypothetical protein
MVHFVYRHCFEQDKFEGIKGEIRSRKSNDRQYNGQKEKTTNGDIREIMKMVPSMQLLKQSSPHFLYGSLCPFFLFSV